MRRATVPAAGLAILAAITIGIVQARDAKTAKAKPVAALSRAQVSRPLAGAPTELAALRKRVNERIGGGLAALQTQLRALRGHPVVVNMWASWCAPCRFELPFFQRQALARGKRVAFLGVNVNDSAGAAAMAASYPMPYPSFTDRDQKIVHSYGGIGLPLTVFYDAAGRRQMVHQGVFASERLLSDAIDRYALHGAG